MNIYRKYYGGRMTVFLFVSLYLVMVLAALLVEGMFTLFGWITAQRTAITAMAQISFNYTTVLNLIFAIDAAILVTMFLRTGGPKMMHDMEKRKAESNEFNPLPQSRAPPQKGLFG